MIDVNIEFTKGVLFVRLSGLLNSINSYEIEEKVYDIVKDGGIRYVVFNIKDLVINDNVKLFERFKKILEDNDGRMLVCGHEIYSNNFEYVSDELSALKILNS